jgi:isoquinoline 1-oxidoreductase beta subunit
MSDKIPSEQSIRLSRRRFLQVFAGGAGALVVGIRLAEGADMPLPPALMGDTFYDLGVYVRIEADGSVLIGARDPDTGTGVNTSLAQIIADELDADWNQVRVIPLGLGVTNVDGQPKWTYGHQVGGTGNSTPAAWRDLRQMGALARWLLQQAAARRLGVSANRLRSDAGMIIAPDGRRFDYGSLAADASRIKLPTSLPPVKRPADFHLIGKPLGDVDARAIVTGETRYAIDEHYADALVAVLARCPWPDGSLARIDTTDALAVKGVVKVVQLKPERGQLAGMTPMAPAVAILAKSTWAAMQGRQKLKLEWSPGPSGKENSNAFEQQAGSLLSSDSEPTTRVRDDGDVDAAGKKAARRLSATYVQPWLGHVTAEPMNCTVRLDKGRASLVVPTQAPQKAWAVVQRLTGFAPDQIDIRVPRVGGGYGRRLDHDFVAEAVMLAMDTDKPIRLLWTRDEEFGHDFYRSGCVHQLDAVIDHKRELISWNQRMASASALSRRGAADDQLWTSELQAGQLPAGLVPNYRSDWYGLESAIPRGPARGMPHVSNAFAVEGFIDEIAHMMREDPLKTRLRILGEPRQLALGNGQSLDIGRLSNVLQLVADRINWKNWLRTVNGLGIACWHVDGAYVAHAIEASVQGDKLVIERVVCAADVGRVINPKGLEGQIAGATLDALSNALNLAITFKEGQVQQSNFKDYPLANMAQLPDAIEVIVVPDDRSPAGASFLAMPTAAPALANAVFRASAVRIRRLPLMKELLRLR